MEREEDDICSPSFAVPLFYSLLCLNEIHIYPFIFCLDSLYAKSAEFRTDTDTVRIQIQYGFDTDVPKIEDAHGLKGEAPPHYRPNPWTKMDSQESIKGDFWVSTYKRRYRGFKPEMKLLS